MWNVLSATSRRHADYATKERWLLHPRSIWVDLGGDLNITIAVGDPGRYILAG